MSQRIYLAIVATSFCLSCTTVYNPDLSGQRIDEERIVDLMPSRTVKLTNGASQTLGDQVYADMGLDKFAGDLWKWTDAAINLARRELVARGGSTSLQSDNEIILRVSQVRLIQGVAHLRGVVRIVVDLGDGNLRTFEGSIGSRRGYSTVLDAALRVAVANMLSDSEVQQRL